MSISIEIQAARTQSFIKIVKKAISDIDDLKDLDYLSEHQAKKATDIAKDDLVKLDYRLAKLNLKLATV